ncbi:MAG: DegT/DnrJ/EryC1/StrS family aminotransferase, partial [Bradyrhizobium sp.]
NKIITTGEGGAFTTSDRNLYLRAKSLRDHAMNPTRRYHHDECGFNYRMTDVQAALGVAQMERIEAFLFKRAEIMSWYRSAVVTDESIRLNRVGEGVRNVYWMICLEVDWLDETRRDEFMNELKRRGIDTRPYFRTMSSLPMYKQRPQPVAERKAQTGVNLPSYVELTQADVHRIAGAVNKLLSEMRPNAVRYPATILSAVTPFAAAGLGSE